MRLAFLGTPTFALPSLAALIEAKHEIACVYSQPPAPRGRGRVLTPSPVQAFAQAQGLPVRTPPDLRAADEIAAFAALGLDAAVVVAFGQILKPGILQAPRLGCFNLHASLLPRWRGAAPIQRAIMAGDAVTGAQVMQMGEGLDDGPLLAAITTRIDAADTAGILAERLAREGAALLVETLERLTRGDAKPAPQPADGATYARKIKPAEAAIRWDRSADQVDRQIRGLSPHPGAWFLAPGARGSVRVKALLSRVEDAGGEPGVALDDTLLIACQSGAVRVLRAQREGRGEADAAEFVRGFPVPAGTRLA